MKKRAKFSGICALTLTFSLLLGLFYGDCSKVYGHEVYQDKKIRFSTANLNAYGMPDIKVYVATTVTAQWYLNNYSTAISNWNVKCGSGYVTAREVKNIDDANVHLMCDEYLWEQAGMDSNTFGFTAWQDTNFNSILQYKDIVGSSVKVRRAMVILNKNSSWVMSNTTDTTIRNNRAIKTIVHEIGHAIGLGHPDRDSYDPISSTTYSIMRQGYPDKTKTGTTPQTHDTDDIHFMY